MAGGLRRPNAATAPFHENLQGFPVSANLRTREGPGSVPVRENSSKRKKASPPRILEPVSKNAAWFKNVCPWPAWCQRSLSKVAIGQPWPSANRDILLAGGRTVDMEGQKRARPPPQKTWQTGKLIFF